MSALRKVNLFQVATEPDAEDPEGFRAAAKRVRPLLGAKRIGCSVYDLPPGQAVCPYHYEYPEEEWVLVLEGSVMVRRPSGEEELASGELTVFRSGPEGAHRIGNQTQEPARIAMFSSVSEVGVVIYPDSDKVLFYTGNEEDRGMLSRSSADVDYWEGEA